MRAPELGVCQKDGIDVGPLVKRSASNFCNGVGRKTGSENIARSSF